MRKAILLVAAAAVVLVVGAVVLLLWLSTGDGTRTALERQASAWLGEPVSIGAVEASFFPRAGIRLVDVSVGEPARLALAVVDISTDMRALIGRRVEEASVVIADSRIELPLPLIDTASPARGAASADPESAGGIEIVSVREFSLQNVEVVSRGREFAVSAESALEGDRLTVERFTATSGSTALEVDGDVDLGAGIDARLTARANRLDLDELLALAQAFAPDESARSDVPATSSGGAGQSPQTEADGAGGPSVRLAVQLTADTATAGGIEVERLAADVVVDGSLVRLSPLAFDLFGGRYEGSVDAELQGQLTVTVESRLEGLDVAQLAAFGGSPDTISGTLSGEGTFSASGADFEDALGAAQGTGSAAIVNGEIRRLDLLRTVVLFFGRPAPDTASSTDEFERIDASFSLADQVVTADSFSMRSRDADVDGAGTLSLDSKALDGAVQLRLSEELSAQAGTDLTRFTREENRVLLPASLGGTLDDPSLTIDAGAALQRGLQNEIRRRLDRFLPD